MGALIVVMLHLNIIAPLHKFERGEERFFMLCALVCAPVDEPSNTSLWDDSALKVATFQMEYTVLCLHTCSRGTIRLSPLI